jgi:hypothetical protein
MKDDRIATPSFGDTVENGWASEDNPTRQGFFVREFKRIGRLNPGRTWEITDGRGKFWEINPHYIAEDDRLKVTAALLRRQPTVEEVASIIHQALCDGDGQPAIEEAAQAIASLYTGRENV